MEKKVKVLTEEHKEIKTSADDMLNEANERLKKAIKKNDPIEIRKSQGILEVAEQLRQKEREHEQKSEKIVRIVHKRKTNLIDFYKKKITKN